MSRIGVSGWIATTFAVTAMGGLFALAAPAQAEVVVNISKSEQRLAVTVDGTELYRWPVSTGRPGLETPSGTFRPIRLERDWHSRKYDWTPMPWSVFFHRGYAVHGTLEESKLGSAVSHGCVRLLPANASILFSLIRKHGIFDSKIVVMNGPLRKLPGVLPSEVPMVEAPALPPRKKIVEHPKTPRVQPAQVAKAEPDAAKVEREEGEARPAVQGRRPSVEPQRIPDPPPQAEALPQPAQAEAEPQPMQAAPIPRPRIVAPRIVPPRIAPPRVAQPRAERTRDYNRSEASGDEAAVMRSRDAWLRSLDRKYGISR